MERPRIPHGIETGLGFLTFDGLHETYSATNYGQKLSGESRFGRYKPADFTTAQWTATVGPDVNNLEHMRVAYRLSRAFIGSHLGVQERQNDITVSNGLFNEVSHQENFMLTAVVHDWGEAVTGDIWWDRKTKADEEEELEILCQMADELMGDIPGMGERIRDVCRNILCDKGTKLGRAFNALEHWGYVRSALRAWRVSQDIPELSSTLRWMARDVLSNQTQTLINYSKEYPPIDQFLRHNARPIDNLFEIINFQDFSCLGAENEKQTQERFANAHDQWVGFRNVVQL